MPFLRLLGGAAVEQDGRPLSGVLARRHPLALLALLATAPSRTLTRSMLVGHLWPDSPERAARNRLSTCLYRVRKALSAEVLTASGEDVRLDGEALPCDVLQFEDAARQGEWERAVSLYGGELLDGFGLPAAPQFEMRIEQRRARLRKQYKQVLETLALEAEGRDDAASAARWWGELADADPYDARVAERLIASLASAGNVGAAIVAGRRHVGRLRQDLDVEPELATLELLAMLQEGGGREARPAPVAVAETQLDPRAIAVLPFANLGGDEISAAFAAGVHSDLITQLAGVPTLTVISRASVLRYRDSTVPAPEIARTLGVGTLIEGEMQAAAKRVRLNVQMIDARKDTHRWAESYERRLTTDDLLCLQRDLVERIVGSLKATLRDSDGADRRLTENLEAYRLQVVGFARL
ncbi:MAG TPA: BTAD domain-containing putative transcriptional regulator, partial [Longimicrobiales bacterium]|nr:BTAD domain-containing putative transcriptional regulator [Longimicrobiales bacterium]